ncbi:MAG TPA: translocated intimin receptor Tir [Terriglobia bacterium]|nr:translocated intimin receptor Tir [Terriglobia bacterium]
MKTSTTKAILTDSQFWVPILVLVVGILLLVYVR